MPHIKCLLRRQTAIKEVFEELHLDVLEHISMPKNIRAFGKSFLSIFPWDYFCSQESKDWGSSHWRQEALNTFMINTEDVMYKRPLGARKDKETSALLVQETIWSHFEHMYLLWPLPLLQRSYNHTVDLSALWGTLKLIRNGSA